MSAPTGRVTLGAGKDTAGFGGGGTAPPADMLPLLRLRAHSRHRLPRPASASRAWPPMAAVTAAETVAGRGAPTKFRRGLVLAREGLLPHRPL